jgi:hydroxymethylglutaryl-CoA lyase
MVKLIECPRDAMQGWPHIISTANKVAYLQALLQVGFHTLDCVSFVSAKAIPQMADSSKVLEQLDLSHTATKLLAIVANLRGAQEACSYPQVTYLGYPFSLSPTFQQLNANSGLEESWARVQQIQDLCLFFGKQLVVYFSMGFGNPYGDAYHPDLIADWIVKMEAIGIRIFSLADTVGLADAALIGRITGEVCRLFPQLEIGVHLHSEPQQAIPKIMAALEAGCHRFDASVNGVGGCPMAQNELVGNIATQQLVAQLQLAGIATNLQSDKLANAARLADQIFR